MWSLLAVSFSSELQQMRRITWSLLLACLVLTVSSQTFTNMTSLLNTTGSVGCVLDMDGDGLDDVVTILNSSGGYDLYIDYQQPDGTFILESFDTNFQNYPSWSIAAGDLDENGYADLIIGGGSRVSFIYANDDGTDYSEGLIDEYIFSQRTNMVDIDNDGDLDAFACHDVDESHPYRNDGFGNMTEDQTLIQTVPIGGNYASIWTDFDNDGDLDAVVVHQNTPLALLENQASGNHWLAVECVGTVSNRRGIGCRIVAETDGRRLVQQLRGGTSYASSHQPWAWFGLAGDAGPCRVVIDWPSGVQQKFTDVTVDPVLTAVEPQ